MKLRIMTERLLAWMASDEEAYLRDRIMRLRINHGKKYWRGNVTDNSDKIKQHEDRLQKTMKRNCPACHSNQYEYLGIKDAFKLYRCICGSIYTGEIPAQGENYDDYYTEANLTTPTFIRQRLRDIIETFQPHHQTGRLLDVGFGAGDLLVVAKEKGWAPSGVEVSRTACDHGEKLGLDVRCGDLLAVGYPDNHFDVVTASEILEHCDEPETLVDEVYRILRPGGLFWATTPAAQGLSFQLLKLRWTVLSPPEHLQIFSRKAVHRMMSRFGRVKVKTHGFNPVEVWATWNNHKVNRVDTGYALNESLTSSTSRQAVKTALNGTLNAFGLGDSLKIRAVK